VLKKQFSKFIIIGMLSTIVNYFCFYILVEVAHVHYLISSGTGFMMGVIAGYFFNKNWTFQVKDDSKTMIAQYFFVYTSSLLLGLLFLRVQVNYIGVSVYIANFIVIGLTTCTNFIGLKYWAFNKKGNYTK
jgi:putative flippase GtrA